MYQDSLLFYPTDNIQIQFSTNLSYDETGYSQFSLNSDWYSVDSDFFDSLFRNNSVSKI